MADPKTGKKPLNTGRAATPARPAPTAPMPGRITPRAASLEPPTVGENPKYSAMLQGTGTNKLSQISTRRNVPDVDAITGLATITTTGLTVFIEKYRNLEGGLRVSTQKLLDICTMKLTGQNHYRGTGEMNTLVEIPLDDYMSMCGVPMTKPSKDKTRRKVKEDLETLYNTSMEWTESTGGQLKDFSKTRICDYIGIKNGRILFNFSKPLAAYLTHAYITQYPHALLRLDERNPSSYHLGRKLLLHHGIDNNRERGTHEILSVRVLLENAPDIPSYDEVMAGDRHLDKRIITPFQNALDALHEILDWEYCNAKGVPLTEEQSQNFNYGVFIESYVKFMVKDYPERRLGEG